MPGRSELPDYENSPYLKHSSELAYRGDLENAIGFIVSQPPHILLPDGTIEWGSWPQGGPYGTNPIFDELESKVLDAVEEQRELNRGLPPLDQVKPTHLYDHPPAAQGIPEIAVILWEHGKPLVDNAVDGYMYGRFLRDIVASFYSKLQSGNNEGQAAKGSNHPEPLHVIPIDNLPRITWTQGSLIELIVTDLIERVGFMDDLEIDSQARGNAYFSPGHPNGSLTYLVRASFGARQFGYVVNSAAKVIEHFQVLRSELISLNPPDLLRGGIDDSRNVPIGEKLKLRMYDNENPTEPNHEGP